MKRKIAVDFPPEFWTYKPDENSLATTAASSLTPLAFWFQAKEMKYVVAVAGVAGVDPSRLQGFHSGQVALSSSR